MKSKAQAIALPLAVAMLFIASRHSVVALPALLTVALLLAAGYTLFLKDGAKIPAALWVLFSMLSSLSKLRTMPVREEAIAT